MITKVCIIGSINMDQVVSVPHFPQAGETVLGHNIALFPGGKGANQAVAASRLGAEVSFIGAVGNDDYGTRLINHLQAEGINTSGIYILPEHTTGLANITLAQGENSIIVISGANLALNPLYIIEQETLIKQADVILCQLEIPLNAVITASELAKKHLKTFIVNPAPAQALPQNLIANIDILTPNNLELRTALSIPTDETIENILLNHPTNIVLTQGENGVVHAKNQQIIHLPAHQVNIVDTTGAGDTFNGALATFLPLGLSKAIYYANAAAALSITKKGAQSGMPTKTQLQSFLARVIK